MAAAANHKIPLKLLELSNEPIWRQLEIEEAFVRHPCANLCIINHGSPPAVVMGISAKADEVVHLHALKEDPRISLVRRFSGGGTVLVDSQTIFVTLLFQRTHIDLGTSPRSVMSWTENLYRPIFFGSDFSLRENDYCIGNKKIGGNAQYFTRDIWLHHTSFLWSYNPELMQRILKMPPKMPEYRLKREHSDFLDTLSNYFTRPQSFIDRLIHSLESNFTLSAISRQEIDLQLSKAHRKSLEIIDVGLINNHRATL